MAGPQAVRRRGRRPVLRPGRRRGRLPGDPRRGPRFSPWSGPSGSGKSSMLRAGVVAALRRRGRPSRGDHPGSPPDGGADRPGLRPPRGRGARWSTSARSCSRCARTRRSAASSSSALTSEAGRTGRSSSPCAPTIWPSVTSTPASAGCVERGLHLVGGLDEEGLRTAIETPARQAGLADRAGSGRPPRPRGPRRPRCTAPAVARPARDLEATRGQHPDRGRLPGDRRDPRSRGAVRRAALRPESTSSNDTCCATWSCGWSPPAPRASRSAPRSRGAWSAPTPEHEQLIEMLVDARLVTSDDGVLEITHEALARAWPRLRGWLDDDVEGQRIRHHLSAAADAWDTLGRPDSELYRGVRLARALDWQRRHAHRPHRGRDGPSSRRPPATPRPKQQSIAERARAQARLIRRLRIVLAGAVVLLVLALVAGGIAAVQSNRAERERRRGGAGGRLRGRAAGRRPVPAHRRHQPLAAARGRGRPAGRLAGDPGEPAHRAGAAAAAGPVGAARRRLPGELGRQSRRPLDRLLRRPEPDAPLRRLHRRAAAQLRRRPASRGRAGLVRRRSAPTAAARRHPDGPGVHGAGAPAGPGHHGADDEARTSPATSRCGGSTSSSAPTVATWPPPCRPSTARRRMPARPRATRWSGTSAPRPRPPIRVPTGADVQGMALSPDGRTLYTNCAADGVRRGGRVSGSGGARTSSRT